MKLKHVAAAFILASIAGSASAAVLVVRASGPSAKSFPAGKALADNARISLKANDSLVLLDSRGTRTLRGPGVFTPGGPAVANTRSAIGTAAVSTSNRRARIGAVRSVGMTTARSPSIWHVDVSKSTNFCVADPAKVTLWRADGTKAAALTVTGADGKAETLAWAEGSTTLIWPADLTISEGSRYTLNWPGAAAPTALTFRTLAKPGGIEDMAASLIQKGCQAQLDLLIETVRQPGEEAAPAG